MAEFEKWFVYCPDCGTELIIMEELFCPKCGWKGNWDDLLGINK